MASEIDEIVPVALVFFGESMAETYKPLEIGMTFPFGEKMVIEVAPTTPEERAWNPGLVKVYAHHNGREDVPPGIMWLNPDRPFFPLQDGSRGPAKLPPEYNTPSIDSQRPF